MLSQFEANLFKLKKMGLLDLKSYYEVGCGSGAYLYYLGYHFQNLALGGCDYSVPLVETAQKVLKQPYISAEVSDLSCSAAKEMDVAASYDCVFARSVFQYFPDKAYGLEVCARMLKKANKSVGIFDIHDEQRKDDFLAYRRSTIPDYDRIYAQTPHQFYAKEDFLQLAEKNDCEVFFSRDALTGYWNEPFVFDVYFYKR
jgi:ubiquinone/menaquinone biosynthesis C-methylase UbiE